MTQLVRMCGNTFAVTRRDDGVHIRRMYPAPRDLPPTTATVIDLEVLEGRDVEPEE
ncbi:hypothetical protein [Lysobacter sp. CA199]|uniref:hypothetical protein n=1 Tax=Lysobacter sp. CA199 TaxID=3455608 RepID=UPI003F8D2CC0